MNQYQAHLEKFKSELKKAVTSAKEDNDQLLAIISDHPSYYLPWNSQQVIENDLIYRQFQNLLDSEKLWNYEAPKELINHIKTIINRCLREVTRGISKSTSDFEIITYRANMAMNNKLLRIVFSFCWRCKKDGHQIISDDLSALINNVL